MKFNVILLVMCLVLFHACKSDENPFADLNLPNTPFDYEVNNYPDHYLTNSFPDNFQFQFAAIESDNTPEDNPVTNAGAQLGRVLFYEKKLSANETVSCATCHEQHLGFTDDDILSIGFDGGMTRRHSMSLTNARFYQTGKYFWDERAETLEDQVLMPFQDPVEMGLTLDQVVEVVSEQSYAAPLFEEAFGDKEINSERIAKALAQFVRSLVSFNSEYDQGRNLVDSPLDDFPNYNEQENLGKQIFHSRNLVAPSCNSCHLSEAFLAPLLAGNATTSGTNNGLDVNTGNDQGIFESSGIAGHRGKFKVPSLRNIEVGAPYMHDGRFNTLEEVIDHYSTGIQGHPTLQPFLQDDDGNPIRYNFTDEEKEALIAFLKTLTDPTFLQDERFSDPFL